MDDLFEFSINKINHAEFTHSFIVNGDTLVLINEHFVERYLVQEGFDTDYDYMLLLLSREKFPLGKYEKIVNLPKIQRLLVLANKELRLLDYSFKLQKSLPQAKDCSAFYVEERSPELIYLVVTTNSGYLNIFSLVNESLKSLHTIPNLPVTTGALSYPNFCYISELEYRILNVNSNQSTPLFALTDSTTRPFVCSTAENEFLLLGPSSLGLFCNENGPMPRDSLTLPQSIERVETFRQFAIVETDEFFTVYSVKDQKQLKTIPHEKGHMFSLDGVGQRLLFLSCQSMDHPVRMFGPVPWFERCRRLIFSGDLHKAEEIERVEVDRINQASLINPELVELILRRYQVFSSKLKNLVGLLHLSQTDTTLSLKSFHEGNLDPRELLVRFENLLTIQDFKPDPFYMEDTGSDVVTLQAIAKNAAETGSSEDYAIIYQTNIELFQDMLQTYLRSCEIPDTKIRHVCNLAILKLNLSQISIESTSFDTGKRQELFNLLVEQATFDFPAITEILSQVQGMRYPLAMLNYMNKSEDPRDYSESLEILRDLAKTTDPLEKFYPGPLSYLCALVNTNQLSIHSCPSTEQELFEDPILDQVPFTYKEAQTLVNHLKKLLEVEENVPTLTAFIGYLSRLEERYLKTLRSADASIFVDDISPGQLLCSSAVLELLKDSPLTLVYLESRKSLYKRLEQDELVAFETTLCKMALKNPDEYGQRFLDYLKKVKVLKPKELIDLLKSSEKEESLEIAMLHGMLGDHKTALRSMGSNYNVVMDYIDIFLTRGRNPALMEEVATFTLEFHSVDQLVDVTNEFGGQFDVTQYLDHLSEVQLDRVAPGLIKCLSQANHETVSVQITKTLATIELDSVSKDRRTLDNRGQGVCIFDVKNIICCSCNQPIASGNEKTAESDGFVVDQEENLVFHKTCFKANI